MGYPPPKKAKVVQTTSNVKTSVILETYVITLVYVLEVRLTVMREYYSTLHCNIELPSIKIPTKS